MEKLPCSSHKHDVRKCKEQNFAITACQRMQRATCKQQGDEEMHTALKAVLIRYAIA